MINVNQELTHSVTHDTGPLQVIYHLLFIVSYKWQCAGYQATLSMTQPDLTLQAKAGFQTQTSQATVLHTLHQESRRGGQAS